MYKNSVRKSINFSAENLHLYHYAGNNPIKYVDPDGRDIKGVVRGAFHLGLSCLTIVGGIAMMGASGAGEVASAGIATPIAIAGSVGGYTLLVSGLSAFACSAAEMSVEIADCFTDKVPNGDIIPSGIGGCVGAAIDEANGFNAQTQCQKGPNQVKGEAVETLVTGVISTYSYAKGVIDATKITNPNNKDIANILYNEASHQYDMYNVAGAICDLTKVDE